MTLGRGGLILAIKTGRPHLPHRPLRVRPGSCGVKDLGAGAGCLCLEKGQVRSNCQLLKPACSYHKPCLKHQVLRVNANIYKIVHVHRNNVCCMYTETGVILIIELLRITQRSKNKSFVYINENCSNERKHS